MSKADKILAILAASGIGGAFYACVATLGPAGAGALGALVAGIGTACLIEYGLTPPPRG